jgi:hypothetical protein
MMTVDSMAMFRWAILGSRSWVPGATQVRRAATQARKNLNADFKGMTQMHADGPESGVSLYHGAAPIRHGRA